MQIPVFYDSCLQGSRTVLNLNSQWDVKLTSNVLLWRSCLWTKKKSRLTLPHHIECNFFSFAIIKWVETEAKKLSKLRNQSRHTSVHADWPICACDSHRGLYLYKAAFMVRSILPRKVRVPVQLHHQRCLLKPEFQVWKSEEPQHLCLCNAIWQPDLSTLTKSCGIRLLLATWYGC